MPKVMQQKTGDEVEVKSGKPIKPACEKMGLHFGCEDGMCGVCIVEVVEGEENLSELNDKEKDLELNKKNRLACQCNIKNGNVVLRW